MVNNSVQTLAVEFYWIASAPNCHEVSVKNKCIEEQNSLLTLLVPKRINWFALKIVNYIVKQLHIYKIVKSRTSGRSTYFPNNNTTSPRRCTVLFKGCNQAHTLYLSSISHWFLFVHNFLPKRKINKMEGISQYLRYDLSISQLVELEEFVAMA